MGLDVLVLDNVWVDKVVGFGTFISSILLEYPSRSFVLTRVWFMLLKQDSLSGITSDLRIHIALLFNNSMLLFNDNSWYGY